MGQAIVIVLAIEIKVFMPVYSNFLIIISGLWRADAYKTGVISMS
jgi:hypothetical protein